MFSDSTGRRRLLVKWAGAAVGLALISYLAMVGVGLAAGEQAPLTPWLPNNGSSGTSKHHSGRLAAKRSPATRGPQTFVVPIVQKKGILTPARPTSTTSPRPVPSSAYSDMPFTSPPVGPLPSATKPIGPKPHPTRKG